jgi:hypothetical protein
MPRKKSTSYKKKETINLEYTPEEAEYLALPHQDFKGNKSSQEEDEDYIEEEDLEELIEDEEDDEDLEEDDDEGLDEEEEDDEVDDLKSAKKSIPYKKPSEKERYYVNPSEFDKEIEDYYTSGVMSDNLAQMVSKIANKLSYAPNFINYTYREEMVGDGIIRMFKALVAKKYDIAKGKSASAGPFSYFTRIAFNAFRNRIKREKHMRETHEKYQQELMMFSENYNTVVKNNQIRISKNFKE